MLGILKRLTGSRAKPEPVAQPAAPTDLPGVWRAKNGSLKPAARAASERLDSEMADKDTLEDQAPNTTYGNPADPDPSPADETPANTDPTVTAAPEPPDTSTLNQQVVQATQFANYENQSQSPMMVSTPPEIMVGQATGLAVQDAANYMNAIMQIAIAAQAVAIKKAAQGPVQALEEIPLMKDIQNMVTQAVSVYGTVSSTAGNSAKTVISDLET